MLQPIIPQAYAICFLKESFSTGISATNFTDFCEIHEFDPRNSNEFLQLASIGIPYPGDIPQIIVHQNHINLIIYKADMHIRADN